MGIDLRRADHPRGVRRGQSTEIDPRRQRRRHGLLRCAFPQLNLLNDSVDGALHDTDIGLAGLESRAHALHLGPEQAESAVVLAHLRRHKPGHVVSLVELGLQLDDLGPHFIKASGQVELR